jgi:peroxiredoxin
MPAGWSILQPARAASAGLAGCEQMPARHREIGIMAFTSHLLAFGTAAGLALAGGPALAALKIGEAAPDFSAQAALGGSEFKFSLAEALKKGPVVLYFFPKAFTTGCTIEAHDFAEATPQFEALGASVIGMSNDDIETLKKFSIEACRNKFPVAADAGATVTKAYDAALWKRDISDRISYLISPDGTVNYVYASMSPDKHVQYLMKALEALKSKGGGRP